MGCFPSSSFALGSDVTVLDGWGNTLFTGVVTAHPSPYAIQVFNGRQVLVPTSNVRVGTMSAERPYEHAPREVLEAQLALQAAQIAKMMGEVEGLITVTAMQMELLSAPPARALPAGGQSQLHTRDDFAWFVTLVAILENYLSQQCGSRAPLQISDPILRALTSHILD